MGLFNLLSRKTKVVPALIPGICRELGVRLEATREQFFFDILSVFKGEGVQVPG
jgi:hypothetical protein